ncbi:MAG: 1-aminocyclopropane-1-carboxylate deaminase/D-cysteine desulfhydrase [Lachnospiraceae bacterium]
MSISNNKARQKLKNVPKVNLGFFPTPLYRLGCLSDELGVNLYIKRDDFTGKNLFGGNKTRKLEYLIGKAVNEGCEYVFTYGATQSNHAMQTAWAAVSNKLKPILYLAAVVEPDLNNPKANMLLNKIYDAEIHLVSLQENETFIEAEKRSFAMGNEHITRLRENGHKCMDIPMGGADEIGSAAYVEGFVELCEQAGQMGVEFDYLYHATGSGGTLAGLAAGKKLLGSGIGIHSIVVLDADERYAKSTAGLANRTLEYIGAGAQATVSPGDFNLRTEFYAPGYERPNKGGTEAIKTLAKTEGLLLDPVYTGKAFAGLLSDIRNGKIAKGSNIVFLHTGGVTALFAEKEILGDLV